MADDPQDRSPAYAAALGTFGTLVATTQLAGRARGARLPPSYRVTDVVLGAVATHKFTRILAKDAVTTPLRAPFTEFEEAAGSGEVNERPKEGHPAHTVGELLTCPFCLAPWVSTAYVAGLALAPGWARAWAAVFGVAAGSDWLQHGYAQVRTD